MEIILIAVGLFFLGLAAGLHCILRGLQVTEPKSKEDRVSMEAISAINDKPYFSNNKE